jgi:hypothetical protein
MSLLDLLQIKDALTRRKQVSSSVVQKKESELTACKQELAAVKGLLQEAERKLHMQSQQCADLETRLSKTVSLAEALTLQN